MARVASKLISFFSHLFFLQPRFLQLCWGTVLGELLYLLKFRRRIVEKNLSYAFPDGSRKRKKLMRQSYRHLGNLVLELLLIFGPMKKFVQRNVELQGVENWKKANEGGKGAIFVSSHVGNWEIMAATGGILAGIDLMLVTKHLKPEWLHQSIQQGRFKWGVSAAYEPKTMRHVLGHLKKKGTVGFVLDQYAGAPVGVRVPLFGVPVGTSMALATLAKRTGAPVLPVENYRKSNGDWMVIIKPPIPWEDVADPHYELAANTAKYASILESDILAHPAQWLWTHRRFKGDLSPLREEEWYSPRSRK